MPVKRQKLTAYQMAMIERALQRMSADSEEGRYASALAVIIGKAEKINLTFFQHDERP